MGWFIPSLRVVSMSSRVAMPFSRCIMASLMKGIKRALETNPGTSLETVTSVESELEY